ncbi:MAG: pentapeptide repeat-containing protein [bacterium]
MSNKSKDELIKLLKEGFVKEFNEFRSHAKDKLINLAEIDLSGSEIPGVNLSNMDLSGVDFSDCVLTETNFSNCDLTYVNFTGSILKQANFFRAILIGAKFNKAIASDCDFTEADMSGTDLSETDLTESNLALTENLSECIFDSYTIWPDIENLPEGFESEYVEDLSSLKDEDDYYEDDYAY